MARLTIKSVNKAIAARGIDAEIVNGGDYFYFIGDAVDNRDTTSVFVAKLNDLTLDRWLEELDGFIKNTNGSLRY